MKDSEKRVIKASVEAEIIKAKKEIERLKELTQPISPDSSLGRLTRLDAMQSKSVNEKALGNKIRALSGLEHIRRTIDNPDFGLCDDCGDPIPMARILNMPESRLCVDCAED